MKKCVSTHMVRLIAGAVALAGLAVSSAQADTLFTLTGVGTADFSFINGNTQLELVLTNTGTGTLQGTAISGLDFTVGGFTLGSLTSATATDGLISSPYTTVVSPGADILKADGGRWEATSGPNGLTALSGTQPEEMIISSSISPNGGTSNFDPYVSQVGTFIYSVSNVSGTPTFADSNGHVTFLLGTGPDTSPASGGCTGDDCGSSGSGNSPEPASLGILGLGVAGLLIRRKHK